MAAPQIKIRFSPTTNPLDAPVWVDITKYVMSFQTRRGRQFELNRIEAGTCSIKLDNSDRRFDPVNTLSPYYPYLDPLNKIQIYAPGALPVDGGTFTLSGNEITDSVRTTDVQGDGASIPGGVGIWEATTNLITNSGAETDVTSGGVLPTGSTISRDTTSNHTFGVASFKVVI